MQKTFLMWGIVCGRLAAKAFCKGIVSTARRGGRVGSRFRRGGVTGGDHKLSPPGRRAHQALQKAPPRRRREEINAIVSAGNPSGSFHSPPPFAQGRLSPPGDYQPGPKILLLLFSQKSSAAPVCGGRKKRKGAPGVVPEASFPDQLGRGFMLLSVRGTGKFTRKAKAGPSAPAPFWQIWGCGWCS